MTFSDLFNNPFSSASAQHRLITSGSTFGDASHVLTIAVQLNGPANLNAGQGFAGGFVIAVLNSLSDSSKTVTYNNDGVGGANLPVTIRIPQVTPNASGDRVVIVFDIESENAYEFYHFAWNSGSPTAGEVRIFDPAGMGHGTSSNTSRVGESASGASMMLGLVRGNELSSGPINHIMSASMADQGSNQMLANAFRWPAFHKDGFCDGVTKCIGDISWGQLFGIPPGVDKGSIGLTDLGERLFDQLSNYGLRPIDGAGANAHNRGDQVVTAAQRSEFNTQIALLWPYLRPVLNDYEGEAAGSASGHSTAIATGGAPPGSIITAAGNSTSAAVGASIFSAAAFSSGRSSAFTGDEGGVGAGEEMNMTLLSIINDVQDRIDLPRASSVIGSTDQNTIQLRALATEHGRSLVGDNDWRALISEETFTTSATETQTNFFPANFYKLIDGSMWNRTRLVPMIGPLTSQEWQAIKVTTISSLYPVWRHAASLRDIQIMPTPSAGEVIGYDCMKDAWVLLASGGTGTRFVNDNDSTVYDEELMILGIKWRWLKHKDLDWQPAKVEYDEQLRQMIASDSARRTLSMAKGPVFDIEPHVIVPDRIML